MLARSAAASNLSPRRRSPRVANSPGADFESEDRPAVKKTKKKHGSKDLEDSFVKPSSPSLAVTRAERRTRRLSMRMELPVAPLSAQSKPSLDPSPGGSQTSRAGRPQSDEGKLEPLQRYSTTEQIGR